MGYVTISAMMKRALYTALLGAMLFAPASGFGFMVTIPGSTAPGNYIIRIKGVSGGVERFVDILLQVNLTSPEFREI